MRNKRILAYESEQEDPFHNHIDKLNIGICVFNSNGQLLFSNLYFQNLFGYSRQELQLKSIYELFVPNDAQLIIESIKKRVHQVVSVPDFYIKGKTKSNKNITLQLISKEVQGDSTVMIELLDSSASKSLNIKRSELYKELNRLIKSLDQEAAVSVIDKDGKIIYVNDLFCKISKYDRVETVGKNYRTIKCYHLPEEIFQQMMSIITKGQVWKGATCHTAKDGTVSWKNTTIIPFLDEEETPFCYVAVSSGFANNNDHDTTYELALYDCQTQLPNKKLLEIRLEREFEIAKLTKGKFSLMLIDIHTFKNIDKNLNVKKCKRLLEEAVDRIRRVINVSGGLYRVGEAQFAVILSNSFNEQQIKGIATGILNLLNKPFSIHGTEIYTSINIGVSVFAHSGKIMDYHMENNHSTQDHFNLEGKTHKTYSSSLYEKLQRKFILRKTLKKAIEDHEFFLEYQPKVNPYNNNITGAEALVRWNHPTLGIVPPHEFIPMAEDEGIINSIGEMVLSYACWQNKQWQTEGLKPIVVSVNFSAIQLMQPDIIHTVERTLEETGLDPKWLEIEITESAFINEESLVSTNITELKKLGVSIAIDDFGTGYASLSYLKNFKANTLKIDKSFINGVPIDSDSSLIVSAIIELAKKLNIKTVAEGVETIEQLNFLIDENCDEIQGFLYSKPVTVEKFETLLTSNCLSSNKSFIFNA